jgi:hypothetical protein
MTIGTFIIQKCIMRSVFACIMPITIYSLGYLIADLCGAVGNMKYNDYIPWLIILAFTVIYPLSQFSLWLLFAPVMALCRAKLWMDPSKYPHQAGFAPCDYQDNYEIMKVSSGKIPSDI